MTEPVYTKGVPADNGDILDFANYVFSLDGKPTEFTKVVPKCYLPGNEVPDQHYMVKEDGRIKAMIGSFPLTLRVLGEPLKVAGIGTVSVHPYARGRGYMKALMHRAQEDMVKDGVDLSILGGQRQRYEYFSYVPAGPEYVFRFNPSNIRHHLKALDDSAVTLRRLTRQDTEELAVCRRLHERQPLYCERSGEKFFDILSSWKCEVFAACENDTMIGYCITGPDRSYIPELETETPAQMDLLLKAFFRQFGCRNVEIPVAPFETEKLLRLGSYSEDTLLTDGYYYAIFRYEPVVRALLKLKSTYTHLADGTLVLEVKDRETLKITVKDGVPTVSAADGPADLTLDHLQATRLLLSPSMAPFTAAKLPAFAAGWFPLPAYIFHQDGI